MTQTPGFQHCAACMETSMYLRTVFESHYYRLHVRNEYAIRELKAINTEERDLYLFDQVVKENQVSHFLLKFLTHYQIPDKSVAKTMSMEKKN